MNPFQNEQQKPPIASFFHLLMTKLLSLILLNLLFLVTCLPLLTISPSIAALNKAMQHLLSGGDDPLWNVYFRTFKAELFASFGIGVLSIGLMAGIAYGIYFYGYNADGWLNLFFFFVLILLFMMAYIIFMWAYMMIVSVSLPLKSILKNAVILTFSYPKQTLFGGVGSLTIVLAGVVFFPYSTPLLLSIVFSFASFVSIFVCFPVIQRNVIK